MSEDGLDLHWYCTCEVRIKGTGKSVRICGNGIAQKKAVAITLAADNVVAKLKTCKEALKDEYTCKVLDVPFDSCGGHEKTISGPESTGGKSNPHGREVPEEKISGAKASFQKTTPAPICTGDIEEKIGGININGNGAPGVPDAIRVDEEKICGTTST